MKKFNMNKACPAPELSSISAFPPRVDKARHVNNLRTRLDVRNAPTAQALNSRHIPPLRNSSQPPFASQSQQSFSHLTQLSQNTQFSQLSQNTQFSQNSQEEILTNGQWRYGSQERENPIKRNTCFAPYSNGGSNRDESSQLLPLTRPVSTNRIHHRINHTTYPDDKHVEQRLCSVYNILNKVLVILESLQSDLMQVNKAVKDVSLENEGIRQKIVVQENTLQQMIKEEEELKETLLGTLNTITDRITKETSKFNIEEISDALKTIPNLMTERLSAIKSELCLTFRRNLQDMGERIKTRENEYRIERKIAVQPADAAINSGMPSRLQSKRLRGEHHKPFSDNLQSSIICKKPRPEIYNEIYRTAPITESPMDISYKSEAMDWYQPFNHTYARMNRRENYVIQEQSTSNEQQKSRMSGITMSIEDDEVEEHAYFVEKSDRWDKVGKFHFDEKQKNLYEDDDDEEIRRLLKKARRRKRLKASYKFTSVTNSSSSSL